MPTTRDALDALFHPRAVAVIGVSDDGTAINPAILGAHGAIAVDALVLPVS